MPKFCTSGNSFVIKFGIQQHPPLRTHPYSGCQKSVPILKRFFYNHLCRNSVIRNIIMKSGINWGHG